MKGQVTLFKKNDPFQKYKKVLFEFIINILSFSILIIVQQLLALPIISRFYHVDIFGQIILAFGISNIITSMFGFSIGNARLLDQKSYNYTYLRLLNFSNFLAMIIGFIVYILIFPGDYVGGGFYSVVCALGNIRYFLISEYRLRNDHNWILNQNIVYFLGIIIGIILFNFYLKNWLIIFLFAEIASVITSYYFLFAKEGFLKLFVDKSRLSLTNSYQLMINNGVSYSLSQYDRFVIYPILGASNVSLYYSTSISARIGSLIMNPMSNFFLGKLANKNSEIRKKTVYMVILSSIVVVLSYFLLTIGITPILIKILYPSFLTKVKHLILPICLGTALMGGINLLKPVVMKYKGVKYYNKLFIMYGFVLVFLSVILSIKYGLLGIAIANVISNALLYFYLLFGLKFLPPRKM
ncbi:lipopolysaccharide biosynthesis protein [Bacillus infantis]|uniref:Oligosaccharide flippase family protein n=1 Tax=Bacillus infantis TaxID=324767 RepID=A0A5D4R6J1_9BACI|nr:hypothetical protein [Bacillus infantis]TYS47053.1 hypothetical protein FZD51_16470 [Bacillus infantis]